MNVTKINDDKDLLNLMLKDNELVDPLYKSTKLWKDGEKPFIDELKNNSLLNFRKKDLPILKYFSDRDLLPVTMLYVKSKGIVNKIIYFILKSTKKNKKLDRCVSSLTTKYSGVTMMDINMLCYKLAEAYGKSNNAKPIDKISASLVGNPENVFRVDGRPYTLSILYYYCQYVYCCGFMNFNSVKSLTELGGGFGKQIELFKKIFPNMTFYLFDIIPTLYICEQYLKSVFPDSVVSYRETRNMKTIPKNIQGKIFIFGSWKMAELKNLSYDMFFNSASLQEVEPNEVLNYLKLVNQQTNKYVFLHEKMKGTMKGMIEKTVLKHYVEGLKDFKLEDVSNSLYLPKVHSVTDYSYSIWSKSI